MAQAQPQAAAASSGSAGQQQVQPALGGQGASAPSAAAAGAAYYRPQVALREAALHLERTALLFIDVQNYNCHPRGAIWRAKEEEGRAAGLTQQAHPLAYWQARLEEVQPRWAQLQAAARAGGVEVLYTVIQSLTRDGRDRSLDYKISGFHVPPGSWDGQVLDAIRPAGDEIVLPKTSSNVFVSTNVDYLLRCLGKSQLILAGCVTDQCVDAAVRSACDLGYLVTLVPDCCATYSEARHTAALAALAGYCRQRDLAQLLPELEPPELPVSPEPAKAKAAPAAF